MSRLLGLMNTDANKRLCKSQSLTSCAKVTQKIVSNFRSFSLGLPHLLLLTMISLQIHSVLVGVLSCFFQKQTGEHFSKRSSTCYSSQQHNSYVNVSKQAEKANVPLPLHVHFSVCLMKHGRKTVSLCSRVSRKRKRKKHKSQIMTILGRIMQPHQNDPGLFSRSLLPHLYLSTCFCAKLFPVLNYSLRSLEPEKTHNSFLISGLVTDNE